MKDIVKKYIQEAKLLIKSKTFIIPFIIVTILSLGFAITNYSIGIDDLSLNKYVDDVYILAAKRWGTWLLYNVLNIHKFTPFWLDFLTTIIMMLTAIFISTFIKIQTKGKVKTVALTIFSCLMISNPVIVHFFMYQTTNIAVVISNLLLIIAGIIIFENYFNNGNRFYINLLCALFISFPISMYESCVETFLVFLFMATFIRSIYEKEKFKKLFKYFILNIIVLLFGMFIYYLIGTIIINILNSKGIRTPNYAYKLILWENEKYIHTSLKNKIIINNALSVTNNWKNYLTNIATYLSLIAIGTIFVRETYLMLKNKNATRFISTIGFMISSVAFVLLQGMILYRIQYTWCISVGLIWMYIYQISCNKKITEKIILILIVWIILLQSQILSYSFYDEYQRFEKEKNVAIDIGITITKEFDYKNKPVVYYREQDDNEDKQDGNEQYGSVIKWGIGAFNSYGVETTKFINNFGFNLKYALNSDKKKAKEEIKEANNTEDAIYETENYIVVNLDKYDLEIR